MVAIELDEPRHGHVDDVPRRVELRDGLGRRDVDRLVFAGRLLAAEKALGYFHQGQVRFATLKPIVSCLVPRVPALASISVPISWHRVAYI